MIHGITLEVQHHVHINPVRHYETVIYELCINFAFRLGPNGTMLKPEEEMASLHMIVKLLQTSRAQQLQLTLLFKNLQRGA